MVAQVEEPGRVMVVAAAGGHDHDGVALLHGRRQHHGVALAALASRRRQLDHRHPTRLPSDAATADLE